MIKVCKFGGSSLSSGEKIKRAAELFLSDPSRRAVAVSAAGARFSGDAKVTDLLFLLSSASRAGVGKEQAYAAVRERIEAITREIGGFSEISAVLDELYNAENFPVEYVVSRGEYISAKLFSHISGVPFFDAKDLFIHDYAGALDLARSSARTSDALAKSGKIVVPGFYGGYPNGNIRLFSRGGGDLSGAILSRTLRADEYENFTDVDGIFSADPRIVPAAAPVPEMSYDDLLELACCGAAVVQRDAVLMAKEGKIPLRIRSASGNSRGTLVTENRSPFVSVSAKSGLFLIKTEVPERSGETVEARSSAINRALTDSLAVLSRIAFSERVFSSSRGFSVLLSGDSARARSAALAVRSLGYAAELVAPVTLVVAVGDPFAALSAIKSAAPVLDARLSTSLSAVIPESFTAPALAAASSVISNPSVASKVTET